MDSVFVGREREFLLSSIYYAYWSLNSSNYIYQILQFSDLYITAYKKLIKNDYKLHFVNCPDVFVYSISIFQIVFSHK